LLTAQPPEHACHHTQASERVCGETPGDELVTRALVWIIRKSRSANFARLRQVFPQADQVGKFTVFNIGGNKVRLIAALHYDRNKIYIRHVLTHEEYNAGKWRN
jgi:mRNA interferase HigB